MSSKRLEILLKKFRQTKKDYEWFVKNMLKQVSCSKYNRLVAKGTSTISDVFSVSDEAFAHLIFKSNFEKWGKEAELRNAGNFKEKQGEIPQAKYTKHGNQGGGFTKKGIERYNELYDKVNADRKSEKGIKFEKDFKDATLKAGWAKQENKKRKAAPTGPVVVAKHSLAALERQRRHNSEDDSTPMKITTV